ncbi:MAG: TlpA family protein disulfide reductase [Methylobacteriaceae bacterium]|nr:TlpA family protein disulfide reductase [Methylobacteriaceae bacterium]
MRVAMPVTRRSLIAAAGVVALGSAADAASLRPFRADVAAPALSLPRLGDGRASLDDALGRTIVVSFWATWCAPCRRELPSLLRLQVDLREAAMVIAVAVGEPAERVGPYLDRGGLRGLDVALDVSRVAASEWRVQSLPQSYVLDRQRRIAFSALGEVDWDDPAVRGQLTGLAPAG